MTCAAEWRIGPSSPVRAVLEQLLGRAALGRLEDLVLGSSSAVAVGSCSLIVSVS